MQNCFSLKGPLTIPNSVVSIGDCAFTSCIGLDGNLTFPKSVKSIKYYAFQGCSGLTSLTIPASVSLIEFGAFDGCPGFTGQLKIPNTISNIPAWTFQSCRGFTSLVLPNNLKIIEYDAFNDCIGFTGDLIIPGSVESITDGFRYCTGFTSCYIPNSVKFIKSSGKNYGTFSHCTGLKKVVVDNASPLIIDTSTFSGVNKTTCELIVPTGSKVAYQAATGWGLFKNITEAIFVVLNTQGGYPAKPITTTATDSIIAAPDNPIRDGYSFAGWYKEAACTNAWDFAIDIVTGPVTLFAKWTDAPAIIEKQSIANFTVYPNPAKSFVHLTNLPNGASISVFSMDGKLMKQQNISERESNIDISQWTNGVYLLKVKSNEGIMIQKFIKK